MVVSPPGRTGVREFTKLVRTVFSARVRPFWWGSDQYPLQPGPLESTTHHNPVLHNCAPRLDRFRSHFCSGLEHGDRGEDLRSLELGDCWLCGCGVSMFVHLQGLSAFTKSLSWTHSRVGRPAALWSVGLRHYITVYESSKRV